MSHSGNAHGRRRLLIRRRYWIPVLLLMTGGTGVLYAARPLTVSESVEIAAPVDVVWAYLSASNRAREWSVYFHHISPLSHGPSDGALGSVRRCYRLAKETGVMWDEEVVGVEPFRTRQIRVYNLAGGKLGRFTSGVELWVTQRYESNNTGRTTLSFATGLTGPQTVLHRVLFRISSREVARIFRLNLENIGAAVEHGESYVRLHEWEARNVFD